MKLPKAGTVEVVPSILSADFGSLADEVKQVESAGVKMLHLDVMDGHFVPNLTIGPPVVASLRKHSDLFFDAHLMITEPDKYAPAFVDAGANNITFHIEVAKNPAKLVEDLHKMGVSASICVNPETPVSNIRDIAPMCDMVLVMTVRPGFGGQKFMPAAAQKIVEVRQLVGEKIRVEVDGGIDSTTTQAVVSYGADTLVAGNAIFGQKDRVKAIEAIRSAVK